MMLKPGSLVKSSLNDVGPSSPMRLLKLSHCQPWQAFLTTSSLANQHRADNGLVVSMPEKKRNISNIRICSSMGGIRNRTFINNYHLLYNITLCYICYYMI
jgi:hypothetical protein